MAKGKAAEPEKPEETKEARFIRIFVPRRRAAVRAIRLIANCRGPSYDWTPETAKKFIDDLQEELDELAVILIPDGQEPYEDAERPPGTPTDPTSAPDGETH